MYKRITSLSLPDLLAWFFAWLLIAVVLALVAASIVSANASEISMEVGELEAVLTSERTETTLAAGSSAFATIEITTNNRRHEAELDLSVEGGKIVDISGKRIDAFDEEEDGATFKRVEVKRLRRRRTRTVTIEVLLGIGGKTGQDSQSTILHVKLRDTDHDITTSRTLRWKFKNCSAAYQTSLNTISENTVPPMLSAQKLLRSRDESLSGRWLFSKKRTRRRNARHSKARQARICARFEEQNGKRQCTRWRVSKLPAAIPAKPTREERKLIAFVSEFIERRGYAPEFGDNGRYRWLTYRVSNDLNSYVNQPSHPALCSGARELLTFYKGNMRPFESRTRKVKAMLATAHALAKARVAASFDLVRKLEIDKLQRKADYLAKMRQKEADEKLRQRQSADTSPSPAALPSSATRSTIEQPAQNTGATEQTTTISSSTTTTPDMPIIEPPQKAVPEDMMAMIRELAALVLPGDRLFALKVETKPLSALRFLTSELSSIPVKRTIREAEPEDLTDRAVNVKVMRLVLAALHTIEAGTYVKMLQSRYIGINRGIYSTLDAIGQAHKKTCHCR